MRRAELTREDAVRILAGFVRNHVTSGTVFSPWHGCDLCYRDGWLCRTDAFKAHGERPYSRIMPVEDIYGMSDEDIARRVGV